MSYRVVAPIVVFVLPTAFSPFFRRLGDKCPATALPSAPRGAKLILSCRADFTPWDSVRKNVFLDGRPWNLVPADNTRGRGERAMALKDSFESDTAFDIINVLSVIA